MFLFCADGGEISSPCDTTMMTMMMMRREDEEGEKQKSWISFVFWATKNNDEPCCWRERRRRWSSRGTPRGASWRQHPRDGRRAGQRCVDERRKRSSDVIEMRVCAEEM